MGKRQVKSHSRSISSCSIETGDSAQWEDGYKAGIIATYGTFIMQPREPTCFIAHLVYLPTTDTPLDQTAMTLYQIRYLWRSRKNQITMMNCVHESSHEHLKKFLNWCIKGRCIYFLLPAIPIFLVEKVISFATAVTKLN